MALEASDLFIIQKDTDSSLRKLTTTQLSSYFSSQGSMTYKGTADFTDSASDPADKNIGDTYINSATDSGTFAWAGAPADPATVNKGDRAVYNGSGWDVIQSGVNTSGVVEIGSSAPITVNPADPAKPVVGVSDASTVAKGVVILAKDADLNVDDSTAVVTAGQLKATNDAMVTNVSVTAPITNTGTEKSTQH